MTIRWTPDTCSCVVDMDNNANYVDWVQKCPGHADKDGQALVDAVVEQCKNFQISEEDQQIKSKRNENMALKRDEIKRIEKLGTIVKNTKLIRNSLL